MALNKSITNALGVSTTYHKLRNVEMRKVRKTEIDPETAERSIVESYIFEATIFSYVTPQHRQASESYAADRKRLAVEATLEEGDTVPCYRLVYNKLKETETFEGATDC